MSTTPTPSPANPWINTLVGVAITVATSWYALGEKMDSVVDARMTLAEANLRAHVDSVAAARIVPFTVAVNAQLDTLRKQLATEVHSVGDGIADAVRTGNRPFVFKEDTSGNAEVLRRLDEHEELMRGLRTLLLLEKLPDTPVGGKGTDDKRNKKK